MTDEQLENRAHAGKLELLDGPMDYKELLKKYMRLVSDCEEGYNYLVHASLSPNGDFTEEEIVELERIYVEVADE